MKQHKFYEDRVDRKAKMSQKLSFREKKMEADPYNPKYLVGEEETVDTKRAARQNSKNRHNANYSN